MKNLTLFLRKYLRTPAVLLVMVLLLLISSLSFGYDSLKEDLPCAICSEDDSEEAAAVLAYLTNYDFVIYETREEVEEAVSSGTADCGAVLLSGFDEAMRSGDMEGVCEFILSSRTDLKSAYSLLLSGAILDIYTPYLTEQAFSEQGYALSEEEIAAYMEEAAEQITALDFEVVDVEGEAVSEESSILLPVGLIAITIFVAYGFLAVAAVRRPAASVRLRFAGRKRFLMEVILPRLLALGLLLLIPTVAGVLLGRLLVTFDLLVLVMAVIGYFVILTAIYAGLILLPVSDEALILFVVLEAAASLVLCPMHTNLVLYVPKVRVLRVLDIPYWLYMLSGL